MQYFFVNQDVSKNDLVIVDEDLLNQMKNVLRFRIGDECIFLDGEGARAKGSLKNIEKKSITVALSEHEKREMPKRKIRLYTALSKKPATFELIVQKATELGVTDIIPLITKRCQITDLRKTDRLNLIIKEAAEQCERFFLPRLHEVITLEALLKNPTDGIFLCGDARNYDKKLSEIKFDGDVNLIIGPEGGLTDSELSEIRKIGGTIFILGENVLRMETAAISALSIILFK